MGARQRQWARRKRAEILAALGGFCSICGSTHELEFDVKVPVDDGEHHGREWSWRMSFYREQFARGNLQVLCSPCNTRKGNKSD